MNVTRQQASMKQRFDHLVQVITSERFLQMKGLNNEVPFFICPYLPEEAVAMSQLQRDLLKTLERKGLKIIEINLYDLAIEILRANDDWDWYLENEASLGKEKLKDDLQGILHVERVLVPAMAEKMAAEHDVVLISGVGEIFPIVRSHNVLNNLQRAAKHSPTLMFFPGAYTQSDHTGASLELFGRLHDDKYYRAFNIFQYEV